MLHPLVVAIAERLHVTGRAGAVGAGAKQIVHGGSIAVDGRIPDPLGPSGLRLGSHRHGGHGQKREGDAGVADLHLVFLDEPDDARHGRSEAPAA